MLATQLILKREWKNTLFLVIVSHYRNIIAFVKILLIYQIAL